MINKYRYINVFKFRNVPIRMHYSLTLVLIVVYLYGFINTYFLIGAFALTLIMLAHELGHMWFANRKGLEVYQINLFVLNN